MVLASGAMPIAARAQYDVLFPALFTFIDTYAVSFSVLQSFKDVLRQGDESLFRPLAVMDMNHHSLAVDIGNLKDEAFREP